MARRRRRSANVFFRGASLPIEPEERQLPPILHRADLQGLYDVLLNFSPLAGGGTGQEFDLGAIKRNIAASPNPPTGAPTTILDVTLRQPDTHLYLLGIAFVCKDPANMAWRVLINGQNVLQTDRADNRITHLYSASLADLKTISWQAYGGPWRLVVDAYNFDPLATPRDAEARLVGRTQARGPGMRGGLRTGFRAEAP